MAKNKKIEELQSLIYKLEGELSRTKEMLGDLTGEYGLVRPVDHGQRAAQVGKEVTNENGLIIEGVFNGQIMIGPDGKEYSVPANYASKSKLVEGDILKLTIDKNGSFIYKQIAPAERNRLIGHLIKNKDANDYLVLAGDKVYKVLLASVTYFKGAEGDEVVILVPKDSDSTWAAVENVIKNKHYLNESNDDLSLNL
ncbi:MAG: hypothetical protein C3F02_00850 [Parcubacteria group bacterium]|nr:MAG: hypothetical protein C3F02_00850 [Parcubacteria group bacterium]